MSPELGQRIRDFPQQAAPLQREVKMFLGKGTREAWAQGAPSVLHCPALK